MDEQTHRFPRWVTLGAAGVVVGLALGFVVGWWLWPVQYTNTAPNVLRQDYRDDYVTMVATAYEVEQNLELARARLEMLAPDEPLTPVTELVARLIEAGGSVDDIVRLERLAQALGNPTPTPVRHLEEQP